MTYQFGNCIAEDNINWLYDNGVGTGGHFRILVNGVLIVDRTVSDTGSILTAIGDFVEVVVNTTVMGTAETHITGPYTNNTSATHITTDDFTVAVGTYVIHGISS